MRLIYLCAVAMLLSLTSCIKQVDLNIDPGEEFMYVDAFITNQLRKQVVVINQSSPYLGDSRPTPVSNAEVELFNKTTNKRYSFQYRNGQYEITPSVPLVQIGESAELSVTVNGVTYLANDNMYRVPNIDSVTLHYKAQSILYDAGIYAEVHIKDLAGATDYYWLKSTYNSEDPSEGNNLAIDGGYNEGLFDGVLFITPLREAINEYGPFSSGGKIDVRLRSVSKPTYGFLELLFNATSGSGMFAEILKNIPTNFETPPNQKRMLGWFATTAERNLTVYIP